jgi:hypothetical protein
MQVFQGQTRLFGHAPANSIRHDRVSCIPASLRSTVVAALAWVTRPFAVMVSGRPRAEDVVALEYEGRGWCDSTERELINDIATWPHRR